MQQMNTELEARVIERTTSLQSTNQELEMFTSTVAHDLRAPLRAMQGLTQILKEDYGNKLDSTGQDYIARIIESAKRMDTLVLDLLAYTRVSRGPLDAHALQLSQIIAETQTALASEIEEHRAEVIVQGAAGLDDITARIA